MLVSLTLQTHLSIPVYKNMYCCSQEHHSCLLSSISSHILRKKEGEKEECLNRMFVYVSLTKTFYCRNSWLFLVFSFVDVYWWVRFLSCWFFFLIFISHHQSLTCFLPLIIMIDHWKNTPIYIKLSLDRCFPLSSMSLRLFTSFW